MTVRLGSKYLFPFHHLRKVDWGSQTDFSKNSPVRSQGSQGYEGTVYPCFPVPEDP